MAEILQFPTRTSKELSALRKYCEETQFSNPAAEQFLRTEAAKIIELVQKHDNATVNIEISGLTVEQAEQLAALQQMLDTKNEISKELLGLVTRYLAEVVTRLEAQK